MEHKGIRYGIVTGIDFEIGGMKNSTGYRITQKGNPVNSGVKLMNRVLFKRYLNYRKEPNRNFAAGEFND